MGKGSKNAGINRIKTIAVYKVAKEFNITTAYVYGTLNGNFNTARSDEVKKAYQEQYAKIENALK